MKLRLLIVILFTLGGVGANIVRPNQVALAASPASHAAAPTFSTACFTSSNIHQTGTYTVPATGVSRVRAVLYGQSGSSTNYGKPGGLGATVSGEMAVTPGQVFQVGRLTGAPGGAAVNFWTGSEWIREDAGPNGGDAEYVSTTGSDGCQHVLAVAAGGGGTAFNAGSGGNADAGTGATAGGDGGANNKRDGAGGGGATSTSGGGGGAGGRHLQALMATPELRAAS